MGKVGNPRTHVALPRGLPSFVLSVRGDFAAQVMLGIPRPFSLTGAPFSLLQPLRGTSEGMEAAVGGSQTASPQQDTLRL